MQNFLSALAAVTLATGINPCTSAAASAASNIVIIDGDTIAVGRERIRILSIDTPETFHSRCKNELVLGLRAKKRLRELLDGGDIRIERNGHDDRYHRTLANLFAGAINVGEVLINEGLALPYQPGADAKQERLQHWCGLGHLSAAAPMPVANLGDGIFRNCRDASAAGVAPLHTGRHGYSRRLDRDGDGVACE